MIVDDAILLLGNVCDAGESEPIDGLVEEVVDNHVSVFDSDNVVFNGSMVLEGEGMAVVIRTADATLIGEQIF